MVTDKIQVQVYDSVNKKVLYKSYQTSGPTFVYTEEVEYFIIWDSL